MMQVKILYFGMVRDLVQKDEETLEMDDASNVYQLKERLFQEYDNLKAYDNFAVAVNEAYAEELQLLHSGDVVALIPPVSGG